MSILNVTRLPGFHVVALLGAVLAVGIAYIPSASACYTCAGRDTNQFCQYTYDGFVNCADGGGDNGNCVAWTRCLHTRAEDGSPVPPGSCAVEDKRREALERASVATRGATPWSKNNLHGNSSRQIAGRLNNEEIRKLEEMKLKVAEDAEKGLMPSAPVDYIKLFRGEHRDEVWASRVESYMDAQLAKMPLAKTGLSKPIVQCAFSVCEITVVQDATASQNVDTNWQTQFLKLIEREDKLLAVIDAANFTTSVSQQKNGFVSYVFFDR